MWRNSEYIVGAGGCGIKPKKQSFADLYITDQIPNYHVKRADWQEEWDETDKMMAEEFFNTREHPL